MWNGRPNKNQNTLVAWQPQRLGPAPSLQRLVKQKQQQSDKPRGAPQRNFKFELRETTTAVCKDRQTYVLQAANYLKDIIFIFSFTSEVCKSTNV